MSKYQFLVDAYETERLKVASVWGMFGDEDLEVRPNTTDGRGRHALDHMAHQCTSEYNWFRNMFGIDTGEPPATGTRTAFAEAYARDSEARLAALRTKDDLWWESEVKFFDVVRSRAWIMVRRIAHTAHHRGQQTCLLRMLGRDVFSTYGPTADTREHVMYR